MGKLTLLDDAVRMNHFSGFEKNWDKPPEGDVDRGKEGEGGTDEVYWPEDKDGWEFYVVP